MRASNKPSPASEYPPEKALERMKEVTRRIIAVPKSEAIKPKRVRRTGRH